MPAPPLYLPGKRILVTGGTGFLGRHVVAELAAYGPAQVLAPGRREFDLREPSAVRRLLTATRPNVVIHLAAVVGGIGANRANPGRYFYENAVMGIHLLEEARRIGVDKVVSIGTICAYPKHSAVPFSEDHLWNGYPEETNAPYGLAKKLLLVQGQAYHQQYGLNAITLFPVNLYGPHDNFDPQTSHVIPALIKKAIEAREAQATHIDVWGTGNASREFLFVRDAAQAIALAADRYNDPAPVNLGSGQEITIQALAELICELCQFSGELRWDHSQPDGQPRRCLDVRRAQQSFGFAASTLFRDGLRETIAWYEKWRNSSDDQRSTASTRRVRGNGQYASRSSAASAGDASSVSSHEVSHVAAAGSSIGTIGPPAPVPVPVPARRLPPDSSVRRRALITGIAGQDGSYLAEFLLAKGYDVHGIVRRNSSITRSRLDQIAGLQRGNLHYGDVTDAGGMMRLVLELEPDEIYNLAAQSHVRVSFDKPAYTVATAAMGALNMLEAARLLDRRHPVRYYQASTSEMFGGAPHTVPQSEQTPFHPRSPYGCAKAFAHHQTVNYREAYQLFACCGLLFNHESPRRGESFVTRKITLAVGRIREGLQEQLTLGNLDAQRDWGYAKDYVEAMWLMLQQDEPDDFVVATGETHTVTDFLEIAFDRVGLDWHKHVTIDPRFYRPTEVDLLLGDPSKARETLGWTPATSFEALVSLMVDHDWQLAVHERCLREYQAAAIGTDGPNLAFSLERTHDD